MCAPLSFLRYTPPSPTYNARTHIWTGVASGRGPGRGGKRSRSGGGGGDRELRISKQLSYHLRHHDIAAQDPSGWVAIEWLQAHLSTKPTLPEIIAVVAADTKTRYSLDPEPPVPSTRIRANQGHSVSLSAPILTPVTDAAQCPVVIHVTDEKAWIAIQVG